MNNSKQLKFGVLFSYLQMGLNILVGLIYTPVMIRLLGQSEYGLYNTVASTVAMLSVLRLGFSNSYVRYYSIYRKRNDQESIYRLNGIFLTLFFVIGLIAFVCGVYLTVHLNIVFSDGLTQTEYEIAKVLMLLLTLNLAISFPMSVFSNIISANEKFVFLKCLDAIRTVAGPMVTLPFLLLGYGSIGMVTITLFVSIVVDICFVFYTVAVLKNKFIFKIPEKALLKDLIAYTFFLAMELIVDQINWNVDKIILARYKGTLMVAVYSVGYSLYTYYQSFSSAVSGVFIPRIHKIINSIENKEEQRHALTEIFTKVGRIQFLVLGLLASGIIFFGKFFVTKIWAGSEYGDSYYVSILLIVSATIALIQNLGIEIQRAQFKHQFRSIVYSFMALINLILSIYLCQLYGAIGSAIGTALSLIIANGFIMNIYYHKRCNIDMIFFWRSIGNLAKGIVIPFAFGAVIHFTVPVTTIIEFVVEVVIYCIIYCVSMWTLGLNKYEKILIKEVISKVIR